MRSAHLLCWPRGRNARAPAHTARLQRSPRIWRPRRVSPSDVFVTQEVDMRAIKWVGMNYNHNVCVWQPAALARIYALAAAHLVSARGYPCEVLGLQFDPSFPVRGVSLDTHRGILMKLTFLHAVTPSASPAVAARVAEEERGAPSQIVFQRGTAYFGRRCLTYEEVTRIYGGPHVSGHEQRTHFRHLIDPFSMVTGALVSDLLEHFTRSGVSFHPSYVYADVCAAVAHLGRGAFAAEVAARPGDFIKEAPRLLAMLQSLRSAGRKVLLLTNSDFRFVDVGMRHLLRAQMPCPADWPALFDAVIVSAQRPQWFSVDAPFRSLNRTTHKLRWLPVREFRPGHVYVGGSYSELARLVGGISGQDVLYMTSLSNPGHAMGEDPYLDLSVPSAIGWRVGAVVAEVEQEVLAQSSPRYRAALAQLLEVERRVRLRTAPGATGDAAQGVRAVVEAAGALALDALGSSGALGGAGAPVVRTLLSGDEAVAAATVDAACSTREVQEPLLELRDELKAMLNPHFGSCFRTLSGPTLFAHSLLRFSDVYTARLDNLLGLAPDHFLFPLRRALPHEPWTGSV